MGKSPHRTAPSHALARLAGRRRMAARLPLDVAVMALPHSTGAPLLRSLTAPAWGNTCFLLRRKWPSGRDQQRVMAPNHDGVTRWRR